MSGDVGLGTDSRAFGSQVIYDCRDLSGAKVNQSNFIAVFSSLDPITNITKKLLREPCTNELYLSHFLIFDAPIRDGNFSEMLTWSIIYLLYSWYMAKTLQMTLNVNLDLKMSWKYGLFVTQLKEKM